MKFLQSGLAQWTLALTSRAQRPKGMAGRARARLVGGLQWVVGGGGPGASSPEGLLFSPMPNRFFGGEKTQLPTLISAGGRHLLLGRLQCPLLLVGLENLASSGSRTSLWDCSTWADPSCLSVGIATNHEAPPSSLATMAPLTPATLREPLVFNWIPFGSRLLGRANTGPGLQGQNSFPEAGRAQPDTGVGHSEMGRVGSATSSPSPWSWADTSGVCASP